MKHKQVKIIIESLAKQGAEEFATALEDYQQDVRKLEWKMVCIQDDYDWKIHQLEAELEYQQAREKWLEFKLDAVGINQEEQDQ